MMYQKLVRDNIPAIIEKNGETCVTRKLTDKEYETALAEKLQEEVKELLEAYTAKERSVLDCAEEMADVMEVMYAMGKTCAVSKREIEQIRSQKAAEKGTFSKKIFWFRQKSERSVLVTQQDAMRLIRKLIFAKYSQDPTHFCRCVDEIAQTLDEQGDKESARAIRNTSRDGYVKSYYEASRQTQPLGSPFVSYKPAFVIDNKDIALWHAKNDNPPMRVRHILEYIENGEMVAKDVLEYDTNADKWIRVEEECKALT